MDFAELKKKLVTADDDEREALVVVTAARATPSDLIAIAGLLVGDTEQVRLFAIELLARARFAPAAGALLAVARTRGGKERAAALRALCVVTGGGDEARVLESARPFVDDGDEEVRGAARVLVGELEKKTAPLAGGVITFGLLSPDRDKRRTALVRTLKEHGEPAHALASALLETRSSAVRMDLIAGLGTLGHDALARAAKQLLPDADADLVALFARQLEQKLKDADAALRLTIAHAVLEAGARVRSPLARAATDACALVLAPSLGASDQAKRVGDLDAEDLERLKDALVSLEAVPRAEALTALVQGLAKSPERAGAFAEMLYADLHRLGVVEKASLLTIATRASSASGDDADLARHLGPLARLYARLVPKGGALPSQLVVGLQLSPQVADRFALIELCAALATEESADCLKRLSERGDDEVKRRALAALKSLSSDEVEVRLHPDGVELLPRYKTPSGERLTAEGRALTDRHGARWVLSAEGVPVGERETPFGGCRCCFRARALEDTRASADTNSGDEKSLPLCPVTSKPHLIDPDEGTFLEESHPLGGCSVCEAVRPLVRQGERVLCLACHTSYERKGERYVPRKPPMGEGPVYVITATSGGANPSPTIPEVIDAPKPPLESDLMDLPPEVRRAMAANVVLVGRGSFRMWGASGIVVAKSADEIAILTNRHAVEEVMGENAGARVPLTCVTIAGEEAPTRVVWVASQGLDLALLCARVSHPEAVDVIDLAAGRAARPGDEIFAVGNALGLPWSYTAGPASAVRTLPTRQGLDVRFLQTPMNLPSGTGGGGVYLKDGAICGLVSWYRGAGGLSETNFAISVDSIVAGLRRERVRFGGTPLCASE